jgi:phenylacetate-coenzyme A ligase PaaK-like adenylate-forming protein
MQPLKKAEGRNKAVNLLEEWIHSFIKTEAAKNYEFQEFIGKKTLENITKDDVEKYQLYKLRKLLRYVYERSPFYKVLFRKIGMTPEDIKSIQDLAKLPFTESKNIAKPDSQRIYSRGNLRTH